MSEKHKKFCRALSICSVLSCCVSVFAFASLVGLPIVIASSAVGLTIFALTSGIRKYKSVIKKKRKRYNEIVFLTKYYQIFYF